MRFRFDIRDRKTGKIFERNQEIEACSKTEARKILRDDAMRSIPRGRYGARDLGFVPFSDWQIIWTDQHGTFAP